MKKAEAPQDLDSATPQEQSPEAPSCVDPQATAFESATERPDAEEARAFESATESPDTEEATASMEEGELQQKAKAPALPPGALGMEIKAPAVERGEGLQSEAPSLPSPEASPLPEPGPAPPEPSPSASRRGPSRSVSVFRNDSKTSRSKASRSKASRGFPYEPEQYESPWEEDQYPVSSPLSSTPFFLWAALSLLLALCVYLLVTQGLTMFHSRDQALRQNLMSFLNSSSRALGMLLASVITLSAIAIPLTANNYTSKLIGLFINSKVNRAMFVLLIFANLSNLLALLFLQRQHSLPMMIFSISAISAFVCYVLVIPYAFYIFRFLQPDEIIRHIEKEIMDDLLEVKRVGGGPELEVYRKQIIQNLKNLSNIALRSVERYDRDTAMFALEALRHVVHHYFALKKEMPSQWFRVSRMSFLSLSGEMRRRVEHGKTFLEAEVFEEFALVLGVTFGHLRDMVRMISRTVRHIGVEANVRELPAVMELTSLYFNTFVRAALSRREPEAVYMIVYHYRRMGEEMLGTNQKRPVQVAHYLCYYGMQAVRSGLVYVANLISFDLAHMVGQAYEQDVPCKRELFQYFLDFDKDERLLTLVGVLKSRIKLATYLRHLGYEEEAELLCESLKRYDRELIYFAFEEIGAVKTPMFWEVTDRHRHNDYLSPTLVRDFAQIKKRIIASEEADGSRSL